MRYVISYDLNKSGQEYKALTDELENLGFKRILYSQWIGRRGNTTALNLANYFLKYIDTNDRLLVMAMDSSDAAWYNPMVDPGTI